MPFVTYAGPSDERFHAGVRFGENNVPDSPKRTQEVTQQWVAEDLPKADDKAHFAVSYTDPRPVADDDQDDPSVPKKAEKPKAPAKPKAEKPKANPPAEPAPSGEPESVAVP